MALGTQMQQRRATASVWAVSSKVLALGELGITTDTGIIKIGDGVSTWSALNVAFSGVFLSVAGKAADSELLDGIDSTGYYKTADASTAATADKLAKRDGSGKMKAATGTASDDVVNVLQLATAISQESVVRTVTAATTIATTDAGKMVMVDHASLTAQVVVTIPTNTTAAIPIGTWIDVTAIGHGGVKLTPAATVTLSGISNVFPDYNTVRIMKTGTNTWIGIPFSAQQQARLPKVRAIRSGSGTSYTSSAEVAVAYNSFDSAQTYNPDNEWFSIPSPDLVTARRILINKDGEYEIIVNWSGTVQNQGWIRIYKFSANNTPSTRLTTGITFYTGQATWTGRLAAGDSVGGVHLATATGTDNADGAFSSQHDFTITRTGN